MVAPRHRIDLPGEIQENPARLLAQRAQQAGQEALLLTAAADDRQVGPESRELELGVDAGLACVPADQAVSKDALQNPEALTPFPRDGAEVRTQPLVSCVLGGDDAALQLTGHYSQDMEVAQAELSALASC